MSEIRPVTRRSRRTKLKFFGILVALFVVAYFVATSGVFLRSVVLPIAGDKLNADLTVSDISLSPFSSVEFRNLVLRPKGAEPLVTVGHAKVRYGLFAILSGDIRVDELLVESPEVDLVTHPDGTSNLSRWLASLPKGPEKPEGVVSPTPHLQISNVAIQSGRVRITRTSTNSESAGLEITGIQIGVTHLENNGSGKLNLSAEGTESRGPGNQLRFKSTGSVELAFDSGLMPTLVRGAVATSVSSAIGTFKDLANASTTLDLDVKSPDVKQVRLAIRRNSDELAKLVLSGPYDAGRREARIGYEITGLDRKVLGLVGALAGMDFGSSSVAVTGRLDIAQGGAMVTVASKLAMRDFSVRLPAESGSAGAGPRVTPVLEADIDLQTTLNLKDSTALIDRANLSVRQSNVRVIEGSMDRPMNLSWGGARQGFREATYTLAVAGLELDAWKSILGANAVSGVVEANLAVMAKDDGRQLTFQGTTEIAKARMISGPKGLDRLGIKGRLNGTLGRFRQLDLEALVLEVRRENTPLVRVSASGRVDPDSQHTALQVNSDLEVPLLMTLVPVSGAQISSGTLKFAAQYRMQPDVTVVTAELSALSVNGVLGAINLKDYQARWDGLVEVGPDVIRIKRSSVNLQAGFKPGGSFDLEGEVEASLPWQHAGPFAIKRGKLDLRVGNLNEAGLGPWVAGSLAPNRLLSVAIEGSTKAQFDFSKDTQLQSIFKVSNLRVSDAQFPDGRKPIQLGLNADLSGTGSQMELQRLLLQLGPTTNAANEILMTGKLALGATNSSTGSLNVTSEGLDLGPLAAVFSGGRNATPVTPPATAKSTATPPNSAESASAEPARVELPFQRFDTEVKIGRIFLNELAVSNLHAKIGINQGKVLADPFALSINGAPVSARAAVNLGVPGFTYDVALDATKIPVKPVAASVLRGEWMDLHGEVSAAVKVTGAGVTGAGLRKNLSGNVALDAAGLDYQITALKTPLLRTLTSVLSTVLRLPNISQSPIDSIGLKAVASNGVVHLESSKVSSPAFLAETRGDVRLADVLGQSTIQFPVSVSIPKGGSYERLPDFLTLKGTLAKPEPSYDPLAIPGILTRLPAGLGTAVGSGLNRLGDTVNKATGGAASAVGALLGGAGSGSGSATTSNSPSGTKAGSAIGGLLNSLGNAISGPKTTNAPASQRTNAPAPGGLLDLLPKSKK